MSQAANIIGKNLIIGPITVNVKEKIGEGGYAIVYRCVDQQNHEYALKSVNCLSYDRYEQFKQEANVLKAIRPHPNIVRLFAVDFIESKLMINFLFELCPSSAIAMMSQRLLTKNEIIIFFNAIVSATDYLHSQSPPIIHRDLKPENLLVGSDGTPKLCDFGSATQKIYQNIDFSQIDLIKDDIDKNTTPNYRAPEMIDFYSGHSIGPQADIWALGCTLYKLMFRDDLYKIEDTLAILQARVNLPGDVDSTLSAILRSCLQNNPVSRPTSKQLLERVRSISPSNLKIILSSHKFKQNYSNNTNSNHAHSNSMNSNFNQLISNDDAHWFGFARERYKVWVASGVNKWAIKATSPNDDPPKSKHVRRVVVASIKQSEINSLQMSKFLFMNRPCTSDPRIAAKVLYLILEIIQYETNTSQIFNLTSSISKISGFYRQNPSPKKAWGDFTVLFCDLVKYKLAFHQMNPGFEGNLACNESFLKSGKKPEIVNNLRRYVKMISSFTGQLIEIGLKNDIFALIVLSQPAVDEVANSYALLKTISPESIEELTVSGKLLNYAKHIPYLESAVEYPVESYKQPIQRFVTNEIM
ncbi:AGC family protein kinase [Tritrichomonas foetus]|uniref:non-specific serine/threonine protein kinase n=1 Tax=Tritrichomonas foetus TaxID=1144522 RepID=A0A1J4JYS4_9EUKA|nr:AGC family protein kinase [Tritrichomonas foetus]|eukprot:OHT02421.1 AGC family protein kinase [Tritrichomonas foetus]